MRLVFDKTGERFYETGNDRAVLYKQIANGTYPLGVAWNGLISVTERPGGAESNDLFADNIKYASLRSAETFDATIEAYTYPDEFAECDGTAEVAEGVFVGQQSRTPFGFCYRSMIGNDAATGDNEGYKLHLIYNATASPSEKGYSTVNDSPEAITFSWEIETTPINVSGYKPTAILTINSLKCDRTVLDQLEGILYGSDSGGEDGNGSDPRLPLPDEIITMFAAAATTDVTEEPTE